MRTGKLTSVTGYTAFDQTPRYKSELSYYNNYSGWAIGVAVMTSLVGAITFLIARRAFASHSLAMRLLFGYGAIVGALVSLPVIFVLVGLGASRVGQAPSPGTGWSAQYMRDMTYLVSRQLLGHEPAGAWYDRPEKSVTLLANKEMLLVTDMSRDIYALVPAKEVRRIREVSEQEMEDPSRLSFDPQAAVVSFIQDVSYTHERGADYVGPYEIALTNPRPSGIWILRAGPSDDEAILLNDEFKRRLEHALELRSINVK